MPKPKKNPVVIQAALDPVRAAVHSFAIVHQNWASRGAALRAAEELGPAWNVLLHDRFLRFCAARGLQGGRIVLEQERAEVIFGKLSVDWATRYYDAAAPWPQVKEAAS